MKTNPTVLRASLSIVVLFIFLGQFQASYQAMACLSMTIISTDCLSESLYSLTTSLPITVSNLLTGASIPLATPAQASLPPEPELIKMPTYLHLHLLQKASKVYGLVKMNVETDGLASNPFDPAQLDIWVRFTSPQGTVVTVPAFWYQDFDPITLQPESGPGWQVRFTPNSPGIWTAQAEIAAAGLFSRPVRFQVAAAPEAHGFVRIDSSNTHYLAFDDGSQYFPIGMNVAWATSLDNTLTDYSRWFGELSQNGGNFARVWMASWGLGIEWKDTGLGDYTNRLKQAWLLDQVFQMASQHGIYIMLTLINHGAFSRTADSEWAHNPYNASLGGPLQRPEDFVTNLQARELFKRRLRYIAARYGYSPNLMAWEWWNEVDLTHIWEDRLSPWVAEMDQYLKTVDPYRHLTTISYSNSYKNPWGMPEISFVQQHDYSGSDPIVNFGTAYQRLSKSVPGKPFLVSEFGSSAVREDASMDGDPVQLHNGLWAAPFTGFAGTGMYWWWDSYIDAFGFWSQLKGISEFFAGEQIALLKPGDAQVIPARAQALTLGNSSRALVWIRSDSYDYNLAQKAYQEDRSSQAADAWQYQPPPLSGLTVTVSGLVDGIYIASWFDPGQARWLADTLIKVKGSRAVFSLPPFSSDLAVKIVRK